MYIPIYNLTTDYRIIILIWRYSFKRSKLFATKLYYLHSTVTPILCIGFSQVKHPITA